MKCINETITSLTAQVVQNVDANIIGVVEAEDRLSLVQFNKEMLDNQYRHIMLIDGNDERGIDAGLMTKTDSPITTSRILWIKYSAATVLSLKWRRPQEMPLMFW